MYKIEEILRGFETIIVVVRVNWTATARRFDSEGSPGFRYSGHGTGFGLGTWAYVGGCPWVESEVP